MKLNLILNSSDIRSGYHNIDPYATIMDADKVCGEIWTLDWIANDNEVEDIIALDIIDYIGSNDTNEVLTNWLKKLRHNATITIGGIDLREVAHAIVYRRVNLTEANLLLYGEQNEPYQYRKATLSVQYVIQMFIDQGLKVERKSLRDFRYCVTARRP